MTLLRCLGAGGSAALPPHGSPAALLPLGRRLRSAHCITFLKKQCFPVLVSSLFALRICSSLTLLFLRFSLFHVF